MPGHKASQSRILEFCKQGSPVYDSSNGLDSKSGPWGWDSHTKGSTSLEAGFGVP